MATKNLNFFYKSILYNLNKIMLLINLIFIYLILILFTILISRKLELYDKPNIRKIHKTKTLNTGGVSIYISIL